MDGCTQVVLSIDLWCIRTRVGSRTNSDKIKMFGAALFIVGLHDDCVMVNTLVDKQYLEVTSK